MKNRPVLLPLQLLQLGQRTSSGNTTLVSSSTTLASNSGASNSNSATGLESTASGTLLNNKTTTTTSTADVASLSNVASEVGAKSSVTSELAGRVISQTPTATDSQPAKSVVTTTTPVTVETPVQTPVVSTPVETNSKPQNFYWGRWTNYAENADQNIRNDPARSKQVFNANTVYLLASKESCQRPICLMIERLPLLWIKVKPLFEQAIYCTQLKLLVNLN